MSGGHWDYCGYRVQDHMDRIAADETVKKRWPRIATVMSALGGWFYEVDHDMDWDLSGDSEIANDKAWERKQLKRLAKIAASLKGMD